MNWRDINSCSVPSIASSEATRLKDRFRVKDFHHYKRCDRGNEASSDHNFANCERTEEVSVGNLRRIRSVEEEKSEEVLKIGEPDVTEHRPADTLPKEKEGEYCPHDEGGREVDDQGVLFGAWVWDVKGEEFAK